MKILIVEDDYLQAEWLVDVLEQNLTQAKTRVLHTELEFRNALQTLRKDPPDLVLIDVMLRWTDPSPDMIAAPEEVRRDGFFRAGFRCEQLLRRYLETERVPVILYTVLEEIDFQQGDLSLDLRRLHPKTNYISKDSDPASLLDTIRKVLLKG